MTKTRDFVPWLLALALWLSAAPAWAALYLWQVAAPGAVVYLFGSLHVCRADCFPLPKPVLAALDKADTFALELDPEAPEVRAQVLERALYPAGDSLDRHIDPQLLADLKTEMDRLGAPLEPMLRMRPWMAGTTLTMIAAMQAGYQPDKGIDAWLLARAREQGKRVVALETAELQIDAMDRLPPQDQALLIRQSLQLLARDQAKGLFQSMLDAWRRGDGAALDALMRTGLESEPRAEVVFESMLTGRNPAMTARIEEFLRAGGSAFVVVGAGHLAGKGSIVELLRAKGYAVRQF